MTKSFNFPLQKVLDVRTMVEDAKAVELQKAQAETERIRQQLRATEAEKDALVNGDSSDSQEDGSVTLQDLNSRMAYVDQLSEEIEKQGEAVVKSEEDSEEQRIAFVQASKEKMVLEKLKEQHKGAFKKKANQEQVKVESEVASRIVQNGIDQ